MVTAALALIATLGLAAYFEWGRFPRGYVHHWDMYHYYMGSKYFDEVGYEGLYDATAVAIVLIASGTFQKLIAVASFFLAVNYFVSCLALIVLRRREPGAERPFRSWGYPWSAVLVAAGAAAFVAGALVTDTSNAVAAVVLAAAGLAGRLLMRPR